MDACPVGCIYPKKDAHANGKQKLYVDGEQCIDCGACALVCPEMVILSVRGVPRYQPLSPMRSKGSAAFAGSAGGWDGSETEIAADSEIEIPDDKLILNGRVESWSDLMSAMAD
jgi:NAD-dependent dihydropyrimidine dehydrogenase PreA subunit